MKDRQVCVPLLTSADNVALPASAVLVFYPAVARRCCGFVAVGSAAIIYRSIAARSVENRAAIDRYTGWLKIKYPHRRICNISATNGVFLKILEAA